MFKKIFFYSLISIAFSSAAQDNTKAKSGLQFDGIYQSDSSRIDQNDNELRWYIRFYDNGTVLLKETFIEPVIMIKNFIPGNKFTNTGSYKINDNKLNSIFEMGKDLLGNPWFLEGNGTILPNGKIQLQIKQIASDFKTQPYNSTFTFIQLLVP